MESGPPEPPDLEPLHSDPPEPPALGLLESSHPGFETPTLWCFRNTHLGTSEVKSSRTTGFVSSRTTGFEITALGSFRTTRLGTTGIKFSRTTGHGSSRTSGLGTTVLSTVRCTKHYWKLNVATMEYVNPPDSFMQDELEAVLSDTDGSLELVELNPPDPWTAEPREAQELHDGEITLTYLTHACMELKAGNKRMMFDPWLTGPAFARGWWLLHEPPSDAMDRLSQADLIYISHMHSDHLSYPTLKHLSKRCPDIPIYVGDTSRPVFWYLEKSGVNLTNINVVPFGVWQNVDEHLRFMILMDGVHPEMDTCLIVEYKGHMILNTVDCTRPNNGRLPHGVDLMMSDFAGGASGFPMTFHGGKYTGESHIASNSWKADFIKTERKKLLHYKTQLVKSLQPKIYCPFAGYFTEAHPSDRSAITEPPNDTKILKDSWDFDLYLDELNASVSAEIFKYKSWIQYYYNWAGFKGYNLVIRVIETDDDFKPLKGGYEYLVDFLDLSFPDVRPERDHAYEEIKNRVNVMRHVVLNGGLWDDLYIGFNNRMSRDPDVYHHK
ncbi:cytidine monophosphate-N-acetylneuraminic acid hydroxylase-like protein [Labeo rohita]|uniref:Cytidine monophosphate-N-acetylneuraminic acid hydroxylase-like protein n=1 Tax=Labeo rohita TaxID=84645 RepID=A0A498N2L6_LABRO|nr:cytidine monophosphate-N-acetylneuraminic acid hydroxylase-like protein [Labeo rohita]